MLCLCYVEYTVLMYLKVCSIIENLLNQSLSPLDKNKVLKET